MVIAVVIAHSAILSVDVRFRGRSAHPERHHFGRQGPLPVLIDIATIDLVFPNEVAALQLSDGDRSRNGLCRRDTRSRPSFRWYALLRKLVFSERSDPAFAFQSITGDLTIGPEGIVVAMHGSIGFDVGRIDAHG